MMLITRKRKAVHIKISSFETVRFEPTILNVKRPARFDRTAELATLKLVALPAVPTF